MTVRVFKEDTRRDYVRHVRTLAAFIGRSPDTATAEDLRLFQLHQTQSGARFFRRLSGAEDSAQRPGFPNTRSPLNYARPLVTLLYGSQGHRPQKYWLPSDFLSVTAAFL
jgi:hypothetical protein